MARKYKASFVVDRSKWLTGDALSAGAVQESSLLDADSGLMCCMGQICRQLNFRSSEIVGHYFPDDLKNRVSKRRYQRIVDIGLDRPAITREISEENDRSPGGDRYSRKDRERMLKVIFGSIGIRVTFNGRYPDYQRIAEKLGA